MMWRALSLVLALCGPVFAQDGHRPIVPPWVFPNAQVDCDFANQRYYNCPLYSNLSITRASTGLAQDAQSGIWYSYANNILRISSRGLLIEEASTNNALWARDLTQSGTWTASSITPTLDATGIDGTANSATTLTASGANGTILQAITLASATQVYGLHVKGSTLTGNIQATLDNSTYTTLSSANCVDQTGAAANLAVGVYRWCWISQAALTNPTIGIKIVNSGDVVIVDGNQEENLGVTFSTSPIFTTTVALTRAADAVKITEGLLGALWGIDNARRAGTMYLVLGGTPNSANTPYVLDHDTNSRIIIASSTVIRFVVNTTSTNATLGASGSTTAETRAALVFSGAASTTVNAIAANGGTVATNSQAMAGGFLVATPMGVGSNQGTSAFYDGYFKRIAISPINLGPSPLPGLSQ